MAFIYIYCTQKSTDGHTSTLTTGLLQRTVKNDLQYAVKYWKNRKKKYFNAYKIRRTRHTLCHMQHLRCATIFSAFATKFSKCSPLLSPPLSVCQHVKTPERIFMKSYISTSLLNAVYTLKFRLKSDTCTGHFTRRTTPS